jgi:hypothetical protein
MCCNIYHIFKLVVWAELLVFGPQEMTPCIIMLQIRIFSALHDPCRWYTPKYVSIAVSEATLGCQADAEPRARALYIRFSSFLPLMIMTHTILQHNKCTEFSTISGVDTDVHNTAIISIDKSTYTQTCSHAGACVNFLEILCWLSLRCKCAYCTLH